LASCTKMRLAKPRVVMRRARARGMVARWVMGCLAPWVLGLEPAHDFLGLLLR
jgi:hypothetical protein